MKTPTKINSINILMVIAGLVSIVFVMRNLSISQISAAIGVSLTMTSIAWLISKRQTRPVPADEPSQSLPIGYYSWYKFYLDNVHGKALQNDKVTVFDPRPAYIPEKNGGIETQTVKIIKFDMEYVKARVMEEVINHIPSDRNECQMILHGVSYLGPIPEAEKIKDKTFQILKLLSR